jgi:hypothetical protein
MKRCSARQLATTIFYNYHASRVPVTRDEFNQVMSEEPLFDVTLKKKKKRTVAFNEDPLGVDGGASPPTYVCKYAARSRPRTLNAS